MKIDYDHNHYGACTEYGQINGMWIRNIPGTDLLSSRDLLNALNSIRTEKGLFHVTLRMIINGKTYKRKKAIVETWYRRNQVYRSKVYYIHPLLAVEMCLIMVNDFQITGVPWLHKLLVKYKHELNSPRALLIDDIFDDYPLRASAVAFVKKMDHIILRITGIVTNYKESTPEEQDFMDEIYECIKGYYFLVGKRMNAVYFGIIEAFQKRKQREQWMREKILKEIEEEKLNALND